MDHSAHPAVKSTGFLSATALLTSSNIAGIHLDHQESLDRIGQVAIAW